MQLSLETRGFSLSKFERGSINPVNIGEIPPSGLGGSYY